MPSLTLALVQMRVMPGAKDENLERAADFIGRAAGGRADVVVLPEAMTLGWTDPSARREADAIPGGHSCIVLGELARQNGVHVVAGIIESAGGRVYNSAVLIGPDGDVLLHHRKINELDIAHDLYSRGDRLGVAHTALGPVGIMICADAFVEGLVITRTLGQMGARLVLSPCAWAVEADWDNAATPYGDLWRQSYGPPAREFGMWIAGVSKVGWIERGPWQGRKCIGNSIVVGPDGRQVAQMAHGVDAEDLLLVSVDI